MTIQERVRLYRPSIDPTGRIRCAYEEHALALAAAESELSPCQSKRGVVIWVGGFLVAQGHNFNPAHYCNGSDECRVNCRRTAIHAEQAALLHCPSELRSGAEMLHVKTVDGEVVPSGPPSCLECSKLILQAGLKGIWLLHEEGLKFYGAPYFHSKTLQFHGIKELH